MMSFQKFSCQKVHTELKRVNLPDRIKARNRRDFTKFLATLNAVAYRDLHLEKIYSPT